MQGRLQKSQDELASCLPKYGGNLESAACSDVLNKTDDEFWLSGLPNGYLHTGLFNTWNITDGIHGISEYAVAAETEEDIMATVKFAYDHNLRLVVKGTGHDWYGRSTSAGSLLLWTHLRKEIEFHDNFVAQGVEGSPGVPAVTVQSGVQFMDLYPKAAQRGKIVMGGNV